MTASKAPRSIADIVAEIRASMAIDKAQGVNRIPVYVLTPKMIEEILRSEINEPDQGNKSRIVRDHAEATGQPVFDAPLHQAAESEAPNAIHEPADEYEAQLRAEAEAWVQAGLAYREHQRQAKVLEDALEIANMRVSSARRHADQEPEGTIEGLKRTPNIKAAPRGWDDWMLAAQETFNVHAEGDFREIDFNNTTWLAFCRAVYVHLQIQYQEVVLACTCGQDHSSEA